jgi:hypothetical protein
MACRNLTKKYIDIRNAAKANRLKPHEFVPFIVCDSNGVAGSWYRSLRANEDRDSSDESGPLRVQLLVLNSLALIIN